MKPSAAKLFEVVKYDPDTHGAFVRSTFANSALRDPSRSARDAFDAHLAVSGARCVLAHVRGAPDSFAGWAARTPEALVYCYVVAVMRRRGVARSLIAELGYLPGISSIPILYWTPSAQSVALAGKARVFQLQRFERDK